MGACCKLFSRGGDVEPPREEGNKTELMSKQSALAVVRRTRNDTQFTYFLDVFDLADSGQALKRPEFADEANPNFSYQDFHQRHREYYRLVKELGLYVKRRTTNGEQLQRRVEEDCRKIEEGRQLVGFGRSKLPGCLVKMEVQAVVAHGVEEITVSHSHPQHWNGKFEHTFKLALLRSGPAYFEFVVPEIFSSKVRVEGRPRCVRLQIELNESFEAGKTTVCEVMRWAEGGAEGEGVALRVQLCEGQEGERMQAMAELYASLMREFEGDAPTYSRTPTKEQLASRVSRHRSSLNEQYNLNNNSMF